ncbi:MAG TPA: hypothetical protein VMR52_12890 [Dehalococcoidia bacterium]|nr:hypothetical protein [Dehalococcoidia bacterium]
MDPNQYQRLEAQLVVIIKLLSAPMVEGKSIADSAPRLAQVGLKSGEIAEILGTTPNVVRTALARSAKRKGA